jgi:hypothetical protein
MNLLQLFVKAPQGNSINKFQAYAYPEECKALFKEASKSMSPVQMEEQRQILNTFVRNIF